MLYGNYGRGYRSGGFNTDATDLFDVDYEGELSDNFELGIKTSTLQERLIVNIAGFYVNFQNQQQYAISGTGDGRLLLGNFNLPETRIWGLETDLKYRVSKRLDILGGLGFNKSEIQKGGFAGTTDRSEFEGKTTPFVPEITANLALQSNFALSPKVDFQGFVNLSHKGEMFWHEDNQDKADPFELLDTRLSIFIQKNYGFTIWCNNILDTDYYLEYYSLGAEERPAGDLAWVGKPRTFGVELSAKF